jgi:hypothetical protein
MEYPYNGRVPGGGLISLRLAKWHKPLEPDPVSTGVGMGECCELFLAYRQSFCC